jgi:hypothetical protein
MYGSSVSAEGHMRVTLKCVHAQQTASPHTLKTEQVVSVSAHQIAPISDLSLTEER